MAATYGSGNQSPPVIGRPLERVFEDAQTSGEVNLSGRKLKDYPKIANKYDLADTIAADLSKNRLNEVPPEVCEYQSMEKLSCYHNVIKNIPEAIVQLQALTHLNLSRNQLTVLPPYLCHLQMLEVLIGSNNKLVSLPEEIGKLEKLMDLDVSCNEISHLPVQIGDLTSLKCLNIRRNLLVELPVEISKLNLRKLDFASNRIEKIPTVFRKIDTLQEIILDNNPLSVPPAHICTRGRQHIMKFLQNEAVREDRKRGILNDTDMKRLVRKSLPPQQTSDEFRNILDSPESRWKRHTVLSSDSGYSTTDSIEKCGWSEGSSEYEEVNILAIKAAEVVREQRQGREVDLHRRFDPHPHRKLPLENHDMPDYPPPPHPLSPLEESPPITPPTPVAHVSSSSLEDQFTRELQRQKMDYERRKKLAEQLRLQQEEEEREERRRMALRLQEEQQAVLERQREEQQRQMEEAKLAEETRRQEEARQQEELRRQEELRLQEEERQREEARLKEEQRLREEQNQREETKKAEAGRRTKLDNKRSTTRPTPRRHTVTVDTSKKSLLYSTLHDGYYSTTTTSSSSHNASFEYGRRLDSSFEHRLDTSHERSFDSSYDEEYTNYIKEWAYRNKQQLGTSQSFKEERKVQNAQYRRTTSDTAARRLNQNNSNAHVDNLNYINRNGVAEDINTSADSAASTNPSPRTSTSSQSSIPTSPASTPTSNIPSVSRIQSSDRSNQSSPVVRRARAGERSGVSSPATSRAGYRAGTANTNSRIQPPSAKRNNTVVSEEEFKQKHQALSNKHQTESQILKKRLEESKLKHIQKEAVQNYVSKVSATRRGTNEVEDKKKSTISSGSRSARTGKCLNGPNRLTHSSPGTHAPGLSQGSIKLLEEYKEANPNFTIRRQHEMQLEELQQMDQLRNTIETRLKVTLPDNLPEALKDGVVLCHLANQIRPRSVASIHVPSPAVPKLTMAKCRRNVENFLEACRKIGVNQEQVCSAHDVLDERGISRVAITVAALVAIGTNPKQSAV